MVFARSAYDRLNLGLLSPFCTGTKLPLAAPQLRIFRAFPVQETPRPRASAAANWAPLARFIEKEAQLGHWAGKRPATTFVYEFVRFGVKQAWACLFGGIMVGLLVATYALYPRGAALSRYDF